MPRHSRYVKNKRTGDRGSIIKGDFLHIPHAGLVGGEFGQDLHVESSTKRYDIGTRRVTPDGRVFRYAKASNIVSRTDFGLKFWGQIGDGIATTPALAASIGDTTFTIAKSGVAANDFAGGYVIFHTTPNQFRGILSNTATSGGNITITLDQPLTTALVAGSTYTEALQSPYFNVRLTAGPSGGDAGADHSSVAGIPAIITTVANYYLWIQTWGPRWVNPLGDAGTGVAGGERKLVFDCEGHVCVADESDHGGCTGTDGDEQVAGFIIDRGGSGPPLIMLTISP